MRIADSTRYDTMRDAMQGADVQQFRASREASTGQRVNAPSDDPIAAAQALRTSGASARIDAFRATIRAVRGDTALAESTLAQANDLMIRAHEIALQGASGNVNAAERADLGIEVGQLRQAMLSLANQKGSQGYLFAGSKTDTEPFNTTSGPTNGQFVADDTDRQVEVAPNLVMSVSVSGAKAFTTAGGRDILADLDNLATALNTNDVASVQASVNTLDAGSRQLVAARVDAGLKVARLDASDTVHQDTQTALAAQNQALVGVDPASAYSRFIQAGNTVQQAMAVAKKMLDTLGGILG
jgi:flagellar hook-associated protein 3 FlgL